MQRGKARQFAESKVLTERMFGELNEAGGVVTLLYHSHILSLHASIIVLMGPNVIQRPPEETIMNRRIATVVALVVVVASDSPRRQITAALFDHLTVSSSAPSMV